MLTQFSDSDFINNEPIIWVNVDPVNSMRHINNHAYAVDYITNVHVLVITLFIVYQISYHVHFSYRHVGLGQLIFRGGQHEISGQVVRRGKLLEVFFRAV